MKIDIWSDIACPFCYIGTTQLELALEQFEHKADVEVIHHSFQLNPDAPVATEESVNQMLARRKGITEEQAQEMNAHVIEYAESVGLTFNIAQAKPVNTFKAHMLIHIAKQHGKQAEVLKRLFAAYFSNGENVADTETLVSIAKEFGLDETEIREGLDKKEYEQAVQADILRAAANEIHGVPYFIINDTYTLSGAQGVEVFSQMLNDLWQESQS